MASGPTLSLQEIVRRCGEEVANYLHKRNSDPRYCYELFRRAMEERSERAWDACYEQYHRLVRSWLGDAKSDDLVNLTFAKFWQAIPADRFADFPTLAKLLKFLKRCAQTTAIDAQRHEDRIRVREAALDLLHTFGVSGSVVITNDHVLDDIVSGQAFERALNLLDSQEERIVFQASFEWDLKPKAIAERWPRLFSDARQVSRIKEYILRRLRQDEELRALLEIRDDCGE